MFAKHRSKPDGRTAKRTGSVSVKPLAGSKQHSTTENKVASDHVSTGKKKRAKPETGDERSGDADDSMLSTSSIFSSPAGRDTHANADKGRPTDEVPPVKQGKTSKRFEVPGSKDSGSKASVRDETVGGSKKAKDSGQGSYLASGTMRGTRGPVKKGKDERHPGETSGVRTRVDKELSSRKGRPIPAEGKEQRQPAESLRRKERAPSIASAGRKADSTRTEESKKVPLVAGTKKPPGAASTNQSGNPEPVRLRRTLREGNTGKRKQSSKGRTTVVGGLLNLATKLAGGGQSRSKKPREDGTVEQDSPVSVKPKGSATAVGTSPGAGSKQRVSQSRRTGRNKPGTTVQPNQTRQSNPRQGNQSQNRYRNHGYTGTDTNEATLRSDTTSQRNRQPWEYIETLCDICGDWIYIDRKTGELIDLRNPLPELCPFCKQPWPAGKPFTDQMRDAIIQRLKNNRKDRELDGFEVLCARCKGQRKQGETGERTLKENDPDYRGDHICKPTEFERDKKDLESQKFPDDPEKSGGTKRALLIGINYSGQKGELRGCRNDVANIYHYLKSNGYKDENIDILLDVKPFKSPSKKNILAYIDKLVNAARPGDSLFLHYSGHGGQTPDWTGDEADGGDECIYPVDHKREGKIVDDTLHKKLINVPKSVRLTALFDSCHSGSVLDLPYAPQNGKLTRLNLRKAYSAKESDALKNCGDIILWSGCKDSKTSADTKISGTPVGAMSYAFIKANWELLREKNRNSDNQSKKGGSRKTAKSSKIVDYTYEELRGRIGRILAERSQVPQLSSTRKFNPEREKVYV